jgi:D-serine deaminase-like pyridoxal phosphate-dependent protein
VGTQVQVATELRVAQRGHARDDVRDRERVRRACRAAIGLIVACVGFVTHDRHVHHEGCGACASSNLASSNLASSNLASSNLASSAEEIPPGSLVSLHVLVLLFLLVRFVRSVGGASAACALTMAPIEDPVGSR